MRKIAKIVFFDPFLGIDLSDCSNIAFVDITNGLVRLEFMTDKQIKFKRGVVINMKISLTANISVSDSNNSNNIGQ